MEPTNAPGLSPEQVVDMSAIVDGVKAAIEKNDAIKSQIAAAVAEAVKPFAEKSESLANYADAIIDLERKKAELETPPERKGCTFARYTRALALGKGDPDRAAFEAGKSWGADDPVVKALSQRKALTASDPSAAGSIIPPAVSSEFIELLRNIARIRSIARVLPMPNGNLTLRKQTAAATASYSEESANATASQLATGNINMSFKKLIALSPVGNSLLRFAGAEADMLVRDDLLLVMGLREDLAFIQGDGAGASPMGILNLVATANKFNDTGITAAQQFADYTKAARLVEDSNVPITDENGYFLMSPRVFWGAYGTAGGAGDVWPFQAQLNQNRLLGYGVLRTKQVGNDRIYFCHGPSLLIGDSLNLQVDTFDGGAYFDGSNVVSGVSRDETVVRVISEHDFALRHSEAVSVIETVVTGA